MYFNHSLSWKRPTTPIYPASTSFGLFCLSTRHAVRNTSSPQPRGYWKTRWIPMLPASCEETVQRPGKVVRLSPRRCRKRHAWALTGSSTPLDLIHRRPVWRSQAGDPCTSLRAPTTKATSEMGRCECSPCILLRLAPHLRYHRAVDDHL